jgi:hypothetical protein
MTLVAALALLVVSGCDSGPTQHGSASGDNSGSAASGSKGTSTSQSGQQPNARDILDKAIQAQGGATSADRWKRVYVKYWQESCPPDGGYQEMVFEDSFMLPEKSRRVARSTENGVEHVATFVYNGDKAWMRMDKDSTIDIERPKTEPGVHIIGTLTSLTALRDKNYKLTYYGDTSVADKPVYCIMAAADDDPDHRFYIDKESSLVLKSTKRLKNVLTESTYADYKVIDGGAVPMKITTKVEGKLVNDIKIMELKFGTKFDDSLFAKP